MKRFISASLAAIMLFAGAGVTALRSSTVVVGTSLASGENIKGVLSDNIPLEVTFSSDIHPTITLNVHKRAKKKNKNL